MNDPIISPWLIYFLMTIDPLLEYILFLTFASGVGAIMSTVAYIMISENPGDFVDADRSKRITKKIMFLMIPLYIVLQSITIFTPNSKTIIAMMIANEATPNRIIQAGEKAKEVWNKGRDDILMLLQEAKNLRAEEGDTTN